MEWKRLFFSRWGFGDWDFKFSEQGISKLADKANVRDVGGLNIVSELCFHIVETA